MNSFLAIFILLVLFLIAPAVENKTNNNFKPKKERGSLYERVESLAKNQFAKDSNLFQPPTAAQQRAWQKVVEDILNNRLKEVNRNLQKLGISYELILFTDETTGREYVLLQETKMKTGWGFFVFDLKTKNPLAIEITHPVADSRTELEGIDAFLQARARAFLMAGTHRRANKKETSCTQPGSADANSDAANYPESDVAHSTATIFQTTHESLVTANPKTIAVQLHGMATREVCPNVFISSGTKTVTSNAKSLLACLTKQKVEAAIYEGNSGACTLGSTTNVQGRFSNGERRDP